MWLTRAEDGIGQSSAQQSHLVTKSKVTTRDVHSDILLGVVGDEKKKQIARFVISEWLLSLNSQSLSLQVLFSSLSLSCLLYVSVLGLCRKKYGGEQFQGPPCTEKVRGGFMDMSTW